MTWNLKSLKHSATALLVIAALGSTSCGLRNVAHYVGNVRSGTDEAVVLMGRAAEPEEYRSLSTKLDGLVAEVPAGALSADEQRTLNQATQHAAALKELALMLGASDEAADAISADAVELVTGSLRRESSTDFQQRLNTTAQRLLKDTTCSLFADAMSGESAAQLPDGAFSDLPFPQQESVLQEIKEALAAANYDLGEVEQYANLRGLSIGIISRAKGYVNRIENTLTAVSWENQGAAQAYVRHCLR